MSLTFLGWLLIVSSIVIPALLVFSRSEQLPLDISARLKFDRLDEADSPTEKPVRLSRLWPSSSAFGQGLRESAGPLIVTAAAFLVIAGIGAASSYLRSPVEVVVSEEADETILAGLETYASSIGAGEPAPATADGKMLPDVNTMIERLAARLESAPADIQGWRMLGWSYFNMERYDEAAAAYARAVDLDPNAADLKQAYEEAKSKASGNDALKTAVSAPPGAIGKIGDGGGVDKTANPETLPPHQSDAAIRSMVDGLAVRLESSPRDAEGWARLMRSRVVLGETEVAATAFRKALDVFKDDSTASSRITAVAIELGLKAE